MKLIITLLACICCVGNAWGEGDAPAGKSAADTKPKPVAKPKPPKPVRLPRRPYRVSVSVAFEAGADYPQTYRARFRRDLHVAIARIAGRVWSHQVVANDWMIPADTLSIEELTPEGALTAFPADRFDRGFVVLIDRIAGRDRIRVREWNEGIREWGNLATAQTADENELPILTAKLVIDRFRPTLMLTGGDIYNFTMEVQGGSIAPGDPSFRLVTTGSVLQPFFRYLDKKKEVRRIQHIPVTYLNVESFAYGKAKGKIISAFVGFDLGRGRRRVEIRAVPLKIRHSATRLKLMSKSPPIRPLGAHRIAVVKKTYLRDKSGVSVNLMTDRRGYVDVPSDAKQPIVWLYVNSGTMLVARIPYVPGAAKSEELPLPDDAVRLESEGRVQALLVELIDTVARRATMIVKIKKYAKEEDTAKVAAAQKKAIEVFNQLKELEDERGPGYFLRELNFAEQAAIRLKNNRQAIAASKINSLVSKTKTLIEKHLDDGQFAKLKEDYSFLAKADAGN